MRTPWYTIGRNGSHDGWAFTGKRLFTKNHMEDHEMSPKSPKIMKSLKPFLAKCHQNHENEITKNISFNMTFQDIWQCLVILMIIGDFS